MRVVVALEWACVLCGRHIQNDWVSRATNCVKLCVKLEHCSAETIQMIQKAMASSRQRTHSCVMSLGEFIGESPNHPGDSAPLQSRFGALQLLAFLKTKIAYEREEISDCQWDSGKYNGTAYGDCENYVRSPLNGSEALLSYVQCFLYLVSSSINVSIFGLGWWLSESNASLWTKGSLVRFPVREHAWVMGQVPGREHVRGNHTLMFLSLSFSYTSPCLKINFLKKYFS